MSHLEAIEFLLMLLPTKPPNCPLSLFFFIEDPGWLIPIAALSCLLLLFLWHSTGENSLLLPTSPLDATSAAGVGVPILQLLILSTFPSIAVKTYQTSYYYKLIDINLLIQIHDVSLNTELPDYYDV